MMNRNQQLTVNEVEKKVFPFLVKLKLGNEIKCQNIRAKIEMKYFSFSYTAPSNTITNASVGS